MGTLKSMVVPESQRSAIYNIFRVPLNIIVLTVLLSEMKMNTAFACCGIMLAGAAFCQWKLAKILSDKRGVEGSSEQGDSLL